VCEGRRHAPRELIRPLIDRTESIARMLRRFIARLEVPSSTSSTGET
jgi:hypothetical protein